MDFEKALNIFGLTENYNEMDLKQAYRKTIFKYHPDFYENKSDEEKELASIKSKEINIAREILYKYLRDGLVKSKCTLDFSVKLKNKKDVFIREINRQLNEVSVVDGNGEELLLNTKCDILNNLKNFIILVNSAKSLSELSILRAQYYAMINQNLIDYVKKYCLKYSINVDFDMLDLYSLNKLHLQLEIIRKEYPIVKVLQSVFEKYKQYDGYGVMKNTLLKIQRKMFYDIKNNVIDIKDAEIIFDKKLMLEFKYYYRRLVMLDNIKKMYGNNSNKEIIELLIRLEENIDNRILFDKIKKEFDVKVCVYNNMFYKTLKINKIMR